MPRARGTLRVLILLVGAGLAVTGSAQRVEISWPTPNPAWERGRAFDAWVQPTVSGQATSGLWGSVRSNGTQFHEGLDIKPMGRDRNGEATDPVMAAMDGVVRHVNTRAGDSSYGRYVVLEHPGVTPAVYTLYAHLAKVEPGLRTGLTVRRGQTLGLMGRSAGGYAIPKDRAHLHFEIGLRLTDDFSSWFTWRKFGSPNQHGLYNGMNLMGIDPRDFLERWRSRRVDNFAQFFAGRDSAVRLRVVTTRVPDFIRRYPALLRKPMDGLVGGWEVQCDVTGLPFAWTPLSPTQVAGQRAGTVEILDVDSAALRSFRGKSLIRTRGGKPTPGPDLTTMLQLVFGLRS
ncbi:M23 family metallopeptidase [Lacunisphaera limnophila]|uniref:M23 family metallopeptidase n=1 Tax=Lacunisphaera limnophila TaxID=1838286 RepID=UPI001F41B262|nr:M23 family metallopeptidase [Lacunisphaera limnophila]